MEQPSCRGSLRRKDPFGFDPRLRARVKPFFQFLYNYYWRVEVEGLEHVPASGGFVLAPVHRSNLDTPIASVVTRRRLRALEKRWLPRIDTRTFRISGRFTPRLRRSRPASRE